MNKNIDFTIEELYVLLQNESWNNLEMAYNYAKNWEELNIAKEIIFEYKKK